MDRSLFLKSLRAQGYKGKADLAEIKAWMTEQGLDAENVSAKDGTAHKIETVWAATKALALATDDEPEGDEPEVPEVKAVDDDADTKEAKARGRKQHKPDGRGAKALASVAVHTSADGMARKRYEMKIEQTKSGALTRSKGAVYASADEAEAAGAFFRRAMLGAKGFDYDNKESDESIIRNFGLDVKSMSGNLNSAGGTLVPLEFLPEAIWLTEQYGVARKLARTVTMNRDTLQTPRETSIPTFAAANQNGTLTASDPGTDLVSLVAKKFYALTYVSNELFADSAINISDFIGRSFVEGANKILDQCYFLGDGSSTYSGILGLTLALPSSAYTDTTLNTWAGMTEADIQLILGRLENVQGGTIKIACSRQFFVQVFQRLSAGSGGRTQAEFNTNRLFGNAMGDADAMYQGIPVYFSQVLPTATATSSNCAYFGTFDTASVIGDRQELRIASSDQVGFASDQLAFRGTTRFDVAIHGDGRATTYGPIGCAFTGT